MNEMKVKQIGGDAHADLDEGGVDRKRGVEIIQNVAELSHA